MPYKAAAIANYFIGKSKPKDYLTPMKIQKLVYIAHGWHLAIYNEPLIEEIVEAWRYGPVIQSLYYELRGFGSMQVTKEIDEVGISDENDFTFVPVEKPTDEKVTVHLDEVWKSYSKYTGPQLSNFTHQQGTPWDRAYNSDNHGKTAIINDNSIKEHFIELYERAEKSATSS